MIAAGLTLAAFALYVKTASPTFGGLDAAELAIASYTGGVPHATGFPLFLLLGWLFTHILPVGEVVFRTTVMTALFAAAAVGTTYAILRELRLPRVAAALACGLFAVSYYQWSSATATKEHSLHDFLLALTLWLVLRWQRTGVFGWLLAAAGVFGLSLANHMSAALYAPALVVFVLARRKLRARELPALLAAGIVGLLPYLYLPLAYVRGPKFSIAGVYDPQASFHAVNLASPEGMWWMVTGRQFGRLFLALPLELLPSAALDAAYWLWTSFFGLGVVLGVFGLAGFARRNRWFAGLAGTLGLTHLAFVLTYAVPDRDAMLGPVYLLWTLPLGFGIAAGLAAVRRRNWRQWTAAGLAGVVLIGLAWNYPRLDRSHNLQPRLWAAAFLQALPPDSIVLARWETSGPLQYLQLIDGLRPDVQVIDRFLISGPSVSTLVSSRLVAGLPVVVDAEDILDGTDLQNQVSWRSLLSREQAGLGPDGQQAYPGLVLSAKSE